MSAATCEICPTGWSSDPGSIKCGKCEGGKYDNVDGDERVCINCQKGRYRGIDDDFSKCSDCPSGYYTDKTEQRFCLACNAGQYSNTVGVHSCKNCPEGKFQDVRTSKHCKTCDEVYDDKPLPNPKKTDCYKPVNMWKLPKDCHKVNQYLNDSHPSNPNEHFCAPCPLGGSCEGNINWNGVNPKYGWWRLADKNNNSKYPPKCLEPTEKNKNEIQPICAFQQCIYPHACHGAENPRVYTLNSEDGTEIFDPADKTDTHNFTNFTETCDTTRGTSSFTF